MLIIPAIDIKDGTCVRLVHGDPSRQTVYSSDPVQMAGQWVAQGAKRLHVVDLDGALGTGVSNLEVIYRMRRSVDCEIQLGGGLRDFESIRRVMEKGIDRVIIGTALFENSSWVSQAVKEYKGKIMAAVDARDGEVKLKGWKSGSGVKLNEALDRIEAMGLQEVIFTDISRDGTLTGPSLDTIHTVVKYTGMAVYASGGVSRLEDLKALSLLAKEGLKGCIVGKALYDGRVHLSEAIKLCAAS